MRERISSSATVTWKTAMARRKIVPGPVELERSLFSLLAHVNKPAKTRASGTQLMVFAAAISALSQLYKVDLGEDFKNFMGRFPIGMRSGPYVPKTQVPDGVVTGPMSDEKEPLTIEPLPDMFDGLDEDQQ